MYHSETRRNGVHERRDELRTLRERHGQWDFVGNEFSGLENMKEEHMRDCRSSARGSCSFAVKIRFTFLSLLFLSVFLLVIFFLYHFRMGPMSRIMVQHERGFEVRNLKDRNGTLDFLRKVHDHEKRDGSMNFTEQNGSLNFVKELFDRKEVNVGLINIEAEEQVREWESIGKTSKVVFDRVQQGVQWEDFFPEWIDEDEKKHVPKCPEVPMPKFEDHGEFDVVVVQLPCDSDEMRGSRDVFRLQVHLVVGNVVIRNGRKNDGTVTVVFVGSCGPMLEIFRCKDMVKREGNLWIYKPDLRRLKQKLLLPVGSCQLSIPLVKLGQGKIDYNFSYLGNQLDHRREAYVTVLHSSEAYVCGAIALAQSIIRTKSTKDLLLLADKSITMKARRALEKAGWKIQQIERIKSPYAKKDAYNEWNYSKLRIWQLTEYDKIIFIDSDLIVLKNLDPLFVLPQMSAVGNDGVLFNSGIMVVEPSDCTFRMLKTKKEQIFSYNGGDQGFLNEVFTWWHRLPSRYNRLKIFKARISQELPDAYAIHYLGLKPWMCYRDYDCNWDKRGHELFASDSAHRKWWEIYDAMPKRLHQFCALSSTMNSRLMIWRERARNASFANGRWNIQVKDPRQFVHRRKLSTKKITM